MCGLQFAVVRRVSRILYRLIPIRVIRASATKFLFLRGGGRGQGCGV